MAVEPVAARQAAYNASPQQRAEILELASSLVRLAKMPAEAGRQEDDAADFLATDLRFHSLLLEASGNEMFAALVPVFFAIHSGKTVFGVGADKPVANTLDLHQELAQYVSDGDGIHAERTSHALLHEVARSLE